MFCLYIDRSYNVQNKQTLFKSKSKSEISHDEVEPRWPSSLARNISELISKLRRLETRNQIVDDSYFKPTKFECQNLSDSKSDAELDFD